MRVQEIWMIRRTQDTKLAFHKEPMIELREDYISPGRGWYHIYTFRPEQRDEDQLQWLPFEDKETLVLLRLDIGAFRDREIDEATLDFTGRILTRFAQAGKDIILRILYDVDGKGLAHEPTDFLRVCDHMQSLGSVVSKHADRILLAQGLFIGSWGEMHDSKYLEPAQIRKLWKTWSHATGGKVPLAVRKPVQARMIAAKADEVSIGLYDDALLADETHMGTFGSRPSREASWEESWRAEDEYAYIRNHMRHMPIGGEVLQAETPLAGDRVLEQLRNMQITYLNSIYHPDVLEQWKHKKVADGETLYRYIGNHMGYRFVLRDVRRQRRHLLVTIENNGFAPLYEEAKLWLVAAGEQESQRRIPLEIDLRTIGPGVKIRFRVDNFSEWNVMRGDRLYIRAIRIRDGRELRFANEYAGKWLQIGSIE